MNIRDREQDTDDESIDDIVAGVVDPNATDETEQEDAQGDGQTPPDGEAPATENPVLAALDPPPQWSQAEQDTFRKLLALKEGRPFAEAWHGMWKNTQGYQTRRDQEFAAYRQQFDPIGRLVAPYAQQWQMQGMTVEQGVGQLLSWAHALAENPAQMLPQLVNMYAQQGGISDGAALVKQIAQHLRVDLSKLTADEPWIDPAVSEMISPLQRELAQLRQEREHANMWYAQQQRMRGEQMLQAFESEKDEKGALKYPHFAQLLPRMHSLIESTVRLGGEMTLSEAYATALAADPKLHKEAQDALDRASKAARDAEAKKAKLAARNTNGKSSSRQQTAQDLDGIVRGIVGAGG